MPRGRDPTKGDVPYSKAVKPGRKDILLAACLNNIGQALSYIGKATADGTIVMVMYLLKSDV